MKPAPVLGLVAGLMCFPRGACMCADHGVPNEFRGNDRRLLEKARKCLEALHKRDVIAANPKKTSRISTREKVLDPAIAGLTEAAEMVHHQITVLLGCDDEVPF